MPCETHKSFGPCTLFNYNDEDIEWLRRLECNVLTCYGEICPETGKPHLQFHITFKRAYSFKALKKLHETVSWRAQYCQQDNNYVRKRTSILLIDIDNRKKKGGRSDLDEARSTVSSTLSMREVVKNTTNCQAIRSSEIWLKYNEPVRAIQPITVHWYYGGTGTGKTRQVFEMHDPEEVYRPVNYKWWEGYDGHKVVLLDDLRKDFCKFHELLTLIDIYPYKVECKGGSRQIQATTFYITCCHPPEKVYQTEEDVQQLVRRLSIITEFGTTPEVDR